MFLYHTRVKKTLKTKRRKHNIFVSFHFRESAIFLLPIFLLLCRLYDSSITLESNLFDPGMFSQSIHSLRRLAKAMCSHHQISFMPSRITPTKPPLTR